MFVCQYDTDGSGQIEFPEFCNMMSHKMNENDDEEMVRLAFRTLDKDGSGSICTNEFKHLMTHIGEHAWSYTRGKVLKIAKLLPSDAEFSYKITLKPTDR